MGKDKIHANWFMILNMLSGYLVSIFFYDVIKLFGVNIEGTLYDNVVQIIYLAITVTVPSILYFYNVFDFNEFKKNYMMPVKIKEIPYYILIAAALWCVSIFLNGILDMLLARVGITPIEQLTDSNDTLTIFMGFVGVCIAAPIFEEFFFRGVLFSGFREYGSFTAILASSLLFAIAHGSVTIFILPLIYGSACGYVVRYKKSIYPGIIMHAVCNFISWMIFITEIHGDAENFVNLIVMTVGSIITFATVVYIIIFIHRNTKWFFENLTILFKSFAAEITWIGIFIIYFINNILAHMSMK